MQSGTLRKRALFLALAFIGILGWTGCGGGDGDSNTSAGPTKITVTPSPVAVERGQVVNIASTLSDDSGNTYNRTLTYSSASTSVASVSTSGAVCGGTWDSTFVNCTPAATAGTTKITVTSGSVSTTVDVFVHEKISSVTVTPSNPACVKQGATQQFTAKAFAGATDITAQVGPASWTTSNATVATIDSNGLATAAAPGQATIVANISNAKSPGTAFQSCPIARIDLIQKDTGAVDFSIAQAATGNVTFAPYDTQGNLVSNWTPSFISTNNTVATFNISGTVTGSAVGFTNLAVACLPSNCNVGLNAPVYSNPVRVTVTGTAPSTTVYATSSLNSNKTMIPIDAATATAGAAITLPQTPNSMLFGSSTRAFLGSSAGLMIFDTGSNTVTTTVTPAVGRVLAASQDGVQVLTSDGTNVFLTNTSGNNPSVSLLPFSGITAAAFTTDGQRFYLVGGSKLYTIYLGSTVTQTNLSAQVNDVTVSPSNSFVYLAGGSAAGVGRRATCLTNSSAPADISTVQPPTFIRPLQTGQILGADNAGFSEIAYTETAASGAVCPPSASAVVDRAAYGATVTPRQLVVASDGSRAAVTNNSATVYIFKNSDNSVTPVALTGATESFMAGFALGNAQLYVGAGDSKVHRIDIANGTDAGQTTVTFVPDIIAVRP